MIDCPLLNIQNNPSMCVAIIKKLDQKSLSYLIAFIRDERYDREWVKLGAHWKQFPSITGFLDIKSGGTWLAYNQYVIAMIINREITIEKNYKSRGHIILKSINNAKNIRDVINQISKIDCKLIAPFNIIIVDRFNCYYGSNNILSKNNSLVAFIPLTANFNVINRSVPNDLNEKRVAVIFDIFGKIDDPDPQLNSWGSWDQVIQEESYVMSQQDEKSCWLTSSEWGSITADIFAITKNASQPFISHSVKVRQKHL